MNSEKLRSNLSKRKQIFWTQHRRASLDPAGFIISISEGKLSVIPRTNICRSAVEFHHKDESLLIRGKSTIHKKNYRCDDLVSYTRRNFKTKTLAWGVRTQHAIIISAFGKFVGEQAPTSKEAITSRLFRSVCQLPGSNPTTQGPASPKHEHQISSSLAKVLITLYFFPPNEISPVPFIFLFETNTFQMLKYHRACAEEISKGKVRASGEAASIDTE